MKTLEQDFPLTAIAHLTPPPKAPGLDMLRAPFPAHQISKLPKPTKAQTDAVKADFKAGIRCDVCGGWHHPKVVHLDYVGHAALTDRLLDADQLWTWEPLAVVAGGLPALDGDGGLWIKLTVCGVTRLGYGDAQGKTGGDAMKERIGDALRNAAMRFGAALDLWHKGDLHIDVPEVDPATPDKPEPKALPPCPDKSIDRWFANVEAGKAQAADLMAFAKGKFALTDVQEGRILTFVEIKQNPPIDAEFVAEMENAE